MFTRTGSDFEKRRQAVRSTNGAGSAAHVVPGPRQQFRADRSLPALRPMLNTHQYLLPARFTVPTSQLAPRDFPSGSLMPRGHLMPDQSCSPGRRRGRPTYALPQEPTRDASRPTHQTFLPPTPLAVRVMSLRFFHPPKPHSPLARAQSSTLACKVLDASRPRREPQIRIPRKKKTTI